MWPTRTGRPGRGRSMLFRYRFDTKATPGFPRLWRSTLDRIAA
jgi:hypothetical protein